MYILFQTITLKQAACTISYNFIMTWEILRRDSIEEWTGSVGCDIGYSKDQWQKMEFGVAELTQGRENGGQRESTRECFVCQWFVVFMSTNGSRYVIWPTILHWERGKKCLYCRKVLAVKTLVIYIILHINIVDCWLWLGWWLKMKSIHHPIMQHNDCRGSIERLPGQYHLVRWMEITFLTTSTPFLEVGFAIVISEVAGTFLMAISWPVETHSRVFPSVGRPRILP